MGLGGGHQAGIHLEELAGWARGLGREGQREPRPMALYQAGCWAQKWLCSDGNRSNALRLQSGHCGNGPGEGLMSELMQRGGEESWNHNKMDVLPHSLLPLPLQMAATIDMNFQSDLLSIFEENLF